MPKPYFLSVERNDVLGQCKRDALLFEPKHKHVEELLMSVWGHIKGFFGISKGST
jgi:hypothetical protein